MADKPGGWLYPAALWVLATQRGVSWYDARRRCGRQRHSLLPPPAAALAWRVATWRDGIDSGHGNVDMGICRLNQRAGVWRVERWHHQNARALRQRRQIE